MMIRVRRLVALLSRFILLSLLSLLATVDARLYRGMRPSRIITGRMAASRVRMLGFNGLHGRNEVLLDRTLRGHRHLFGPITSCTTLVSIEI